MSLAALDGGGKRILFRLDVIGLRGGLREFNACQSGDQFVETGAIAFAGLFGFRSAGVELAQLTLDLQRAGLIAASARHEPAVVASSLDCDEMIRGMAMRKLFSGFRRFDQVGGSEPGQKMFGRRAERVAEVDELIEALAMAIYMGAGPSVMYASHALEAFGQFAEKDAGAVGQP